MAENKKVRHVLHRRSNVSSKQTIGIERTTLEVNSPKVPNANAIEYGEIAVNYGDGNEALFIRNSADEIIQLNSIENIRYNGNIDTSLNQYLDERYVNRSGDVIYGDITIQAQEDYNDDPKFKYIGSKFEVTSNEVNEDVNSANIDITEQTYVGEKLNITISKGENCEGEFKINTDNINIDVKCEHNSIIEGNSTVEIIGSETKTVKGETLHTYTTNYTTTATVYNLSGTTTNMEGTTLNVEYDNINLNGTTTIDGATEINGATTINGDTEINGDSVNVNGTITGMKGTTLNVEYDNINLNGTTTIDGTTNIVGDTTIDGTTTINGDTNIVGDTTIDGATNIVGDTTIDGATNIVGDTTIDGNTTINGNLILNTGNTFSGILDKTLSFTSGEFSETSFNNSTNATVKIPTDISHLSCNDNPKTWTVFDNRYVNITGDTMSGDLTVGTSATKVIISTSGTINSTGSIYSSDKKLKKNIKSVSNKDIEAVSKIDLKSYKFINDESERERYGVIAQDLEKVGLNNLVVETDNKKGVDYISFLILKIAQLEKRIEELESK